MARRRDEARPLSLAEVAALAAERFPDPPTDGLSEAEYQEAAVAAGKARCGLVVEHGHSVLDYLRFCRPRLSPYDRLWGRDPE